MSIQSLLKKLRDLMRQDAGVGGDEQRLPQIVWILFLKVFDYYEEERELIIDNYKCVIPEGYRWRDWASCINEDGKKDIKAQKTGDELLEFVDELFKVLSGQTIKIKSTDENGNSKEEDVQIFTSEEPQALLVKNMMTDTSNFMKNGVLLRQVINAIDEIDFDDIGERHAFNDIYEQLLKGLQKTNGEFYTGRALTSLIVDKVTPHIGDKVADFACGTGGFLTDAIEYIRKQNPSGAEIEALRDNIYGVEKKQLPYMLCVTNMLLHGIDVPRIIHGNSLETTVRSYTNEDKFDVIVMNPPYGGTELSSVQNNFPSEYRSSETADLFLVEIMYRLKKNGRCGVILPDGIMFGSDNAKIAIKKRLVESFNLHTILRMPGSCFAPYTGIATNILFFDNTHPTENIWFYRYDLPDGQKFSMTKNPMTREKFKPIDEWWDNRREIKDEKENESASETWKSRCVPVSEIIESGYSFDFCSYPSEEKEILSPKETMDNFIAERERLDRLMDEKLAEIMKLLEVK